MKRLLFLPCLLGLWLTSTVTYADGYLANTFLRGSVGWSATGHKGFDSSGFYGADIALGKYFTPNFGVEAGYTGYHNAVSGPSKIKQGGYDVLGLASIHLMDKWSLNGKLGFAYAVAHFSSPNFSARARTLRFAFGAGLMYDLERHLFATFDWYHVMGKKNGFGNGLDLPSTDLISIGLGLRI